LPYVELRTNRSLSASPLLFDQTLRIETLVIHDRESLDRQALNLAVDLSDGSARRRHHSLSDVTTLSTTGPGRTVHQGDALPWLRAAGTLAGASVVTSLPDASELPALGLDGWRRWFDEAAGLTMQCVPDEGVAIFFQSDVNRAGLWIDKGAMVSRAAERAGMAMLFHKIVCRKPPGTLTYGRASYSHLLGFARLLRPTPIPPGPHR